MMNLYNTYLYGPILASLVFFYHLMGESFGLAVISLTVVLRAILVPLTIPSIKSQKKMMDLQPKLAELKKIHTDKMKLQQAQLDLYKQHGVNPGAGCLPQIVQIIILIALYQVFMNFLKGGQVDGAAVNMQFLWLDLSKPDKFYILPALAGLSQLVYSFMLRPGTEHHTDKKEHKQEKLSVAKSASGGNEMDMAQEIQGQMLFMMPLMTTIISLRFPSGLALYWVITTVFSVVQQWAITGPGGLKYYWSLVVSKLPTRK